MARRLEASVAARPARRTEAPSPTWRGDNMGPMAGPVSKIMIRQVDCSLDHLNTCIDVRAAVVQVELLVSRRSEPARRAGRGSRAARAALDRDLGSRRRLWNGPRARQGE